MSTAPSTMINFVNNICTIIFSNNIYTILSAFDPTRCGAHMCWNCMEVFPTGSQVYDHTCTAWITNSNANNQNQDTSPKFISFLNQLSKKYNKNQSTRISNVWECKIWKFKGKSSVVQKTTKSKATQGVRIWETLTADCGVL